MAFHKPIKTIYHTDQKTVGLGDVVKKGLAPIVTVFDKVIKLDKPLSGCNSCEERMKALNKLIPDIKHPFASKPEEKDNG